MKIGNDIARPPISRTRLEKAMVVYTKVNDRIINQTEMVELALDEYIKNNTSVANKK